MAEVSVAWLASQVKTLMNIDDTDLYDDKLDITVRGAISKLEGEGIKNIYDETDLTNDAYDYVLCIAYQVALDFDLITDFNKLYTQYITRANTLRLKQRSGNQV